MNHLTIVKQILCIILVLPCNCWAQSIIFSGKVVDGSNNNLTGALVVRKGTRKNTTADMDGLFYLSARRDSLFVEVSHLGFESQTISLSKTKTTTIILKENSTVLDEAIVTGSHVYRSGLRCC